MLLLREQCQHMPWANGWMYTEKNLFLGRTDTSKWEELELLAGRGASTRIHIDLPHGRSRNGEALSLITVVDFANET